MSLFSRRYLLPQKLVAKNSGFKKLMGDSQGVLGVNPEFLATANSGGIFFEISPFEKAHGLTLNRREAV